MNPEQKKKTLEYLNGFKTETLNRNLGIVFTDLTDVSLTATMPVTPKIHQPFGIMHGGASCVLAETLGSCLSAIHVDTT